MFIIFIVGNILVSMFLYEFILYHEIFDILIPIILYFIVTKKPVVKTLRLSKIPNKDSMLIIFQLYLVSFLLKYGVNYLVALFAKIDSASVTMKVIEMVPNLLVFFISVAIIPVILEELYIRGVVLDKFRNLPLIQASIITGIMFGLMHIDIGQLGYATALGIVMAAIVIITDSIWGGVIFHFFNNFTTFLMVTLLRLSSDVTSNILNLDQDISYLRNQSIPEMISGIIIACIALFLGIYLSKHYIKKLIKINNYREDKSKISWKKLIFNIPVLFIMLIYVSINVLIRMI